MTIFSNSSLYSSIPIISLNLISVFTFYLTSTYLDFNNQLYNIYIIKAFIDVFNRK